MAEASSEQVASEVFTEYTLIAMSYASRLWPARLAQRLLLIGLSISSTIAQPNSPTRFEIEFVNPRRAAYVDNMGKAVLDEVALRLHQDLETTAIVVGFALQSERDPQRLARLRAANVKTYLTGGEAQQGIEPSRVQVRSGGLSEKRVDVFVVAPGESTVGIPGTPFEESSAWVDLSQCAQQDPTVHEISVMFEEHTSSFRSKSEGEQLDSVAVELRADRDLIAVIVGFPDAQGGNVGARRARAVSTFLLGQGHVPSTQIVQRAGYSGGTPTGRAVVTLVHRSPGEKCIGQELDDFAIKKPFLRERPEQPRSGNETRTEPPCVLVGYLFPPRMMLRGWQPESRDITVIVGIPGDLEFEDILHRNGDMRHLIGHACNPSTDRPIGDSGAMLGVLHSEPPSTLKADLVSDGFSLSATSIEDHSSIYTKSQTVDKTHHALWRWAVRPVKENPRLTVRFSEGSTDEYILPIDVVPDWTSYLHSFWGWLAAIAAGIGVLTKGKDLIDWLRPKQANKDR